jgi:hypothetical protein
VVPAAPTAVRTGPASRATIAKSRARRRRTSPRSWRRAAAG